MEDLDIVFWKGFWRFACIATIMVGLNTIANMIF